MIPENELNEIHSTYRNYFLRTLTDAIDVSLNAVEEKSQRDLWGKLAALQESYLTQHKSIALNGAPDVQHYIQTAANIADHKAKIEATELEFRSELEKSYGTDSPAIPRIMSKLITCAKSYFDFENDQLAQVIATKLAPKLEEYTALVESGEAKPAQKKFLDGWNSVLEEAKNPQHHQGRRPSR